MANKITNEQILEMNRQYLKLKTYAATARAVGISPSTVKKYIIPNFVDPDNIIIQHFCGELPQPPIDLFVDNNTWGELLLLSEKEKEDIKLLWKEMSI